MKWTLALATSMVLAISLTGSSNFIAAQSSTPEAQRQPHMSSALDHLREAQKSLEAATHDKGGHRSKALKLSRRQSLRWSKAFTLMTRTRLARRNRSPENSVEAQVVL